MMQRGRRRRLLSAAALIGVLSVSSPVGSAEAKSGAAPPDPLLWLSEKVGQGIGPPGGEIRSLAMAPEDPLRLYAGTASGHLFVTEDGAGLWRDCRVNLPREAILTRLVVSPRSRDTAFAVYWFPKGGGGLLRSLDAGVTWETLAVPGAPSLRAIAIAPSAPDTVYVGGVEGVWRSEDGGDTWIPAAGRARPIREIESLAVDQRFPLRVYAGTWRQAYRSLDGGSTWVLIGRGMDVDRDCFTVALSPHNPDTLFVGTCGWLYRSNDGGDRWINRKNGIPSDHRRIHTIAPDPLDVREVWAGTRGGIYRSSDGAETFKLVRGDISVSTIVTDHQGNRVFAGTEELGVLVGGKGASFVERNAGLEATRVVAFDAVSGDLGLVILAARTENPGIQSLWISRDSGRAWSRVAPGKRFEKVQFLRALEPLANKMLVVDGRGSWWRVSPEGKVAQLEAPPGRLTAVELSTDSTLILATTDTGFYSSPVANLSPIDTTRTPGPRGKGTSADRQKSRSETEGGWMRLRPGIYTALAVEGDRYLALGPSGGLSGSLSSLLSGEKGQEVGARGLPGGVLDAALGTREGTRAFAITRDRVFVSEDGGETWKAAHVPWPASDLRAVVVDPVEPNRAVAVDSHGAVLMGGSAEEPWRALGDDRWIDLIQDIQVVPSLPGIALVATLGHGIRVVPLDAKGSPVSLAARTGRAGLPEK